jgi:uncharacterized RDD family membrane protein YckC
VRWTEYVYASSPEEPAGPDGTYVRTQAGAVALSGWWRRFGGYVLDTLIVAVPSLLLGFAIGVSHTSSQAGLRATGVGTQVAVVVIGVVVSLGYPFAFLRHGGRTVGMMAAGVRAVDRVSGGPLSTAQVVRRVLAFFLLVGLWSQIAVIIRFNMASPTARSSTIGNTIVTTTSVHVPWTYYVALLFEIAALMTTAFWALGNRVNQTLQDKAAGTIVIRARG